MGEENERFTRARISESNFGDWTAVSFPGSHIKALNLTLCVLF